MIDKTIYQFTVRSSSGAPVNLDKYKGKVLLIVNSASECGFTYQYKELQALRDKYSTDDFEILAFPSNDFGQQEPLEGEAIQTFCEVNYGVQFPVFEKIRLKGKDFHPLFKFLSDKKENGKVSALPRWNFYKYLIDRNGRVVDYFYPFTKPGTARLTRRIDQLIKAH